MSRALTTLTLLLVFSWITPGVARAADGDLNIAMVLWRGETAAEKGFKDGLRTLGYSVRYTTMDAGQDKTRLGRIVRDELVANAGRFDYVYTFGTTVSKVVRTLLRDERPHIFNIVAAPVEAGLVYSMQAPGGNITGVTNAIPLSLQLAIATKVIRFERLGLIFNPREKNSMVVRDNLNRISSNYGFEVVDIKSPPARSSLEKNLSKIKDGAISVDAVYLPPDSFVVSNAELIGRELKAARVNSIGSIKKYIDNGALMGVVPNYHALGREAAGLVDRHRKGELLESISVQVPREAVLVINRSTSKALGIQIADSVGADAIFVD